MWAYFASIWSCRYFWLSLVQNDLQMRYRRSLLGIGWSLLFPLTTTLVTCLVFHEVFHTEIRAFAPFVLSGLACWAYITWVILQGCESYVRAEPYIRQHPLPVAVYPLRATLVGMVHFVIALVMVLIMTWIFQGFANLATLIYLAPGLVIYFLFGWSVSILVGFGHLVFRDMKHALEVGFQVLFYLTPIIYPVQVLKNSRVSWLATWNPLMGLLDLVREPLLEARPPSLESVGMSCLLVVVLGIFAVLSLPGQQRRVVMYL